MVSSLYPWNQAQSDMVGISPQSRRQRKVKSRYRRDGRKGGSIIGIIVRRTLGQMDECVVTWLGRWLGDWMVEHRKGNV